MKPGIRNYLSSSKTVTTDKERCIFHENVHKGLRMLKGDYWAPFSGFYCTEIHFSTWQQSFPQLTFFAKLSWFVLNLPTDNRKTKAENSQHRLSCLFPFHPDHMCLVLMNVFSFKMFLLRLLSVTNQHICIKLSGEGCGVTSKHVKTYYSY